MLLPQAAEEVLKLPIKMYIGHTLSFKHSRDQKNTFYYVVSYNKQCDVKLTVRTLIHFSLPSSASFVRQQTVARREKKVGVHGQENKR
jgi:hypothetical protein